MREARHHRSLTSHLAHREKISSDVVALLVAEAVSQAHVASGAIEEHVIPHLPPQRQSVAVHLLRRMESMSMFRDAFLRDLEAFMASVDDHIGAGTDFHWQSDECHVDGGYVFSTRSPEAESLAAALCDLALLRDRLVAALSALRAVRDLDEFLQS
jgi:hypothetical protein